MYNIEKLNNGIKSYEHKCALFAKAMVQISEDIHSSESFESNTVNGSEIYINGRCVHIDFVDATRKVHGKGEESLDDVKNKISEQIYAHM